MFDKWKFNSTKQVDLQTKNSASIRDDDAPLLTSIVFRRVIRLSNRLSASNENFCRAKGIFVLFHLSERKIGKDRSLRELRRVLDNLSSCFYWSNSMIRFRWRWMSTLTNHRMELLSPSTWTRIASSIVTKTNLSVRRNVVDQRWTTTLVYTNSRTCRTMYKSVRSINWLTMADLLPPPVTRHSIRRILSIYWTMKILLNRFVCFHADNRRLFEQNLFLFIEMLGRSVQSISARSGLDGRG